MCMRIYLEQLANEALGIPDGILEMADVVYEEIMEELAKDMRSEGYKNNRIGKGDDVELYLPGPFTIKDETWDGIVMEIDVATYVKTSHLMYDPQFGGASFRFQSSLDSSFKKMESERSDKINLVLKIVVNEDNTWEDVHDFLNSDLEKQIIETISHELKHAFDLRKKNKIKVTDRSRYELSTGRTGIQALDSFNFKLYYSHYIENSVRPVEFAKYLQLKKVTKQDFLKELRNSDTYNRLNEIKNFTYDELVKSVIQDPQAMGATAQIVGNRGEDVDMLDETQLAEILLEYNYSQIIEAKRDRYLNQATDTIGEYSSYLNRKYGESDKDKAVKEVVADLERFGKNYKAFYKYEIKKMNILAKKTQRKLAKLYAYIQ